MDKWIHNISGGTKTYNGIPVNHNAFLKINFVSLKAFQKLQSLRQDLLSDAVRMSADGVNDFSTTPIDNEDFLLDRLIDINSLPENKPFASPDYRTKRDATTNKETCNINSSQMIDYVITEEKYVAGGFLIIKNAEFEDYFKASVYDKDGIIPVEYRANLCENWPVVAEYVPKEWVNCVKDSNDISTHKINTKPLNAKITAGLYLRVEYFSIDSGLSREILINYDLTKKLV